jgi:hypothetical protein
MSTRRMIVSATADGMVAIGGAGTGLWIVDPTTARDLARQLLVAADNATEQPVAHIYQVDNR